MFKAATLAALVVFGLPAQVRAWQVTLEVKAGESERVETPVCALVSLPEDLAKAPPGELLVEVSGPGGKTPGQVVPAQGSGWELWWPVTLKAGQTATYTATITRGKQSGGFRFQDFAGDHLDLLFGGRKVTRFMYAFRYDPNPNKRFPLAKPFTHVFDSRGEQVITSPGGNPYPHHRGIFLGYKVGTPDGKRYDFWHVRNVWQRTEKLGPLYAGPVLGRMTALVKWEIKQDTPVVTEERTVTVYRQSKPVVLLDFVARLRSDDGDLDLGGDPEHAGCQFRPHFEVAKRGKDTRYLFPPGMKPGRGGTKDMPWAANSFALRDSRFNVLHMNHPDNPKGTIYSAYRPYGRFGAFAPTKLPAGKTLTLRYRIFVREGADAPITVEEAQRLWNDFAKPPAVVVK